SYPGHNNRPAFDTAMTVDALFGGSHLHDRVDVEDLLFLYLAVDGHGPGAGLEIFGEFGWPLLVGGEFVEIVVGGDILVGCFLFRGAEGTFLEAVNFGVGLGGERGLGKISEGDTGDGGRAGEGGSGEEVAPVQISGFGSNFRRRNCRRFAD